MTAPDDHSYLTRRVSNFTSFIPADLASAAAAISSLAFVVLSATRVIGASDSFDQSFNRVCRSLSVICWPPMNRAPSDLMTSMRVDAAEFDGIADTASLISRPENGWIVLAIKKKIRIKKTILMSGMRFSSFRRRSGLLSRMIEVPVYQRAITTLVNVERRTRSRA